MPRYLTIGLIAAGIIFFILILVFFGILPGRQASPPAAAALEFWGINDDESVWQNIISDFQKAYPTITVKYQKIDAVNYEDTLVNKMAEGNGPDVFMLKNSWVVKHRDKIYPLPQNSFNFNTRDFQNTFADVASSDLISAKNEILGLPIFTDTLALFYNQDIFNAAGIAQPPQNWDEVQDISHKLTQKTSVGDITRSGLALGTYGNIEHALEILSSQIMQNGDSIISRGSKNVTLQDNSVQALTLYTSFASSKNQNYSWTNQKEASLDALADGTAAMALGFARDIPRLNAKNPHLNLGIAPFPQNKNSGVSAVWGSYFFPTVSRLSKNPIVAWQFVMFLASHDAAKNYLAATNLAPTRRDLIAEGAPASGNLAVFYRQALIAESWPIPDEKAAGRIFQDAVESIVSGAAAPSDAIGKIKDQLGLLIQ